MGAQYRWMDERHEHVTKLIIWFLSTVCAMEVGRWSDERSSLLRGEFTKKSLLSSILPFVGFSRYSTP